MKHLIYVLMLLLIVTACQTQKETSDSAEATDTTAQLPVTLTLKWETDTVLTTCESVLFDSANQILYVSNIHGAPDGKDGKGSIARVTLDGKVENAEWVKGLDAPKGMGLFNQTLFVTDIDRIHEIYVTSGKIVRTHKVDGAQFLNDITVDAQGKVFASDSGTGSIILLENGKVSKWLEGLKGPNGLLVEEDTMLVALWAGNALNVVDLASKQVTLKTDSVESADGIEAIGDGDYFVSSWNGMVHYIDANSKKTTLLDVRADSVSCADIEYIQSRKLLLVPTFFKNTVRAYEVAK